VTDQPALLEVGSRRPHPCPWTRPLLALLLEALRGYRRILDPFGGEGTIHLLRAWGYETFAFDIEPEWAADCGVRADARHPPFPLGWFDAVATSSTFGNRFADGYDGRDGSRRSSYRIALGHELDRRNVGRLKWGKAYRQESAATWAAIVAHIRPDGRLLFHMRDYPVDKKPVAATAWHLETLAALGWSRVVRRWTLPASSVPGAGHDQLASVDHLVVLERY
jgi:hypothetical protein